MGVICGEYVLRRGEEGQVALYENGSKLAEFFFEEVRYGMLMMVLCDREGRVYDVWITFGSVHEVRAFREWVCYTFLSHWLW